MQNQTAQTPESFSRFARRLTRLLRSSIFIEDVARLRQLTNSETSRFVNLEYQWGDCLTHWPEEPAITLLVPAGRTRRGKRRQAQLLQWLNGRFSRTYLARAFTGAGMPVKARHIRAVSL